MPKFAANLTMMFNEVSFLERFGAAAKAGFRAVEFLFPYDHPPEAISAALQAHGLKQALFNLPPGDWAKGERGLAALSDRAEEFRASVVLALTYAKATKVPCLHVMAGLADRSDPAALKAYCAALDHACTEAAPHGIDILIEPINPRDMPGYFLNDFHFAAQIIRDLAHPNLKLQYDIYHRQIIHGDVLKSLETLMPIIGHIQTASVPGRNEPGTGELDDARIFDALDRLGYGGYVGCEYRPQNGTQAGLGWLEHANRRNKAKC